MTRKRLALMSRMLHHHVHQATRDDDDLLDGESSDDFLNERQGKHYLLDSCLVSVSWNPDIAALLPIHLHHELDLVLDQRRGIVLRPRRGEHVLAELQFAP